MLGGGRAGRRRGPTRQEEVGAVSRVCEWQAGRLRHLRVAAALAWEVDARETEVQVLTVWGLERHRRGPVAATPRVLGQEPYMMGVHDREMKPGQGGN